MFVTRSAYTTESYWLFVPVFIYCIHGSLRFELDILFGPSNVCVFYLILCIWNFARYYFTVILLPTLGYSLWLLNLGINPNKILRLEKKYQKLGKYRPFSDWKAAAVCIQLKNRQNKIIDFSDLFSTLITDIYHVKRRMSTVLET